MRNIIFSMFDPEWDGGDDLGDHGKKWRPTLSLFEHDDFIIDELQLIIQKQFLNDAKVMINNIKNLSPNTRIKTHEIEFNDAWDFEDVYGKIHDIADQYIFTPNHTNYYIHMSTGTHVSRISLFMLCESRILPGRMLQSYPDDKKPTGSGWRSIDLSLSKYDHLAKRFERKKEQGQWFLKSGIATLNVAFNQTIEEIEEVSIRSQHPILITGPTGAGKTVLAKRIYELKNNRHQLSGSFIEVNCATLRGDVAMSTLFGHKKGAFTGAIENRKGLLKSADKGLLFLDEIAELGLEEQAILLTAIEKGEFYPVGSDSKIKSDFQLLAGTNKNLQIQVEKGLFREDLFARINLWHFSLPSLQERIEDLEPNIDFELDKLSPNAGKKLRFNQQAYELYIQFCQSTNAIWSGNFRDLNASITRMGTLAEGGRIDLDVVKKEIKRLKLSWGSPKLKETSLLEEVLTEESIQNMDLFDRLQLEEVINVCRQHNSASNAGRALFSQSRTQRKTVNDGDRLRKYLAKFKLDFNSLC